MTKQLKYSHQISLSIFHINIRSLNKNFETLKNIFAELSFEFKTICITETWCHPYSENDNLYNLTNHTSMHQMRKHVRARGMCMFIYDPSVFKLGPDLSVNYESIEVLYTAQKKKFSIKDFSRKCGQIRREMRIWSHFLLKSLRENLFFVQLCVKMIYKK